MSFVRIGHATSGHAIIWREVYDASGLTTPPAHVAGQSFRVGVGATAAWTTHDNEIAESDGAAWSFSSPATNEVLSDGSQLWGWTGTDFILLFTGGDSSSHAPIASPTFTGTPAGPTAAPGTNTTQIATTAFVAAAIAAALEDVLELEDEP